LYEQPRTVEGVYIISVAARILEMHPQTLRKYERLGLISPGRTVGMLRLYSRDDIRKLGLIRHLVYNLGFNLAAVEFTLNLVDNLRLLKRRLAKLAPTVSLKRTVEHELDQLFHSLHLPLED
jgi:MerR family transcriptional regulator/heat shock protein HspR